MRKLVNKKYIEKKRFIYDFIDLIKTYDRKFSDLLWWILGKKIHVY